MLLHTPVHPVQAGQVTLLCTTALSYSTRCLDKAGEMLLITLDMVAFISWFLLLLL